MPLLFFISCRQYILFCPFHRYLHIVNIIAIMYRKQNKGVRSTSCPPRLLCRKREIVNLFPLFGHSSKLLKHDYFSKTSCIQNKTQEKETLSTWLAKICRWRSQGLVLLQSLLPILPILTVFLVLRLTFAGKWVGQSDWISCLKLFCHLH